MNQTSYILDVQKKVKDFSDKFKLEIKVEYRLIDLCSEIGELGKALLQKTNYGKDDFKPNENWEEELGDVLFSLVCVANSTNVNLSEALNLVLNKYEKRIEKTGKLGSKDISC